MSELFNLSVYNPSSLSDDDFLRGFVARQTIARRLIDRLATVTANGRAAHQLIVGQRGMGKTSMLRRLALAARTDPRLSEVLIPLSFREEQYNVHSLEVFWANCLDALADWYERSGQSAKAQQLDGEVAALRGEEGAALALFQRWVARESRRPLLLLDNIDLIFAGLKKEQAALVRAVREPGGVVIVGGSATQVEAIGNPESELHPFFEITQLDRLTQDELIACLRSLAIARGTEGERVLKVISEDKARIRTLYDLTGGNPRTLTLLYMLLELDPGGDVFADLERLLDQVTVLYKARVEDLAPQARVVLDAVALAWNPVIASDVSAATLLDVTAVSSQLDRLVKDGVVEKVTVSKTTKGAYQISERFFNIWYLMRHGPRRQRSRLRWLSIFLRSFYTHAQLVEQAKSLVNSNGELGADGGDLLLALSDAIEDEGWRSLLKNHARDEFEKYAHSLGRTLDEIVDPTDVPRPQSAAEWVRYGNLLRQHLKRAKEAEKAFVIATELDSKSYAAWFNLASVRAGDLADPLGAIPAYRRALTSKPKDLPSTYMLGVSLAATGNNVEASKAYKACLALNPKFYFASVAMGDMLVDEGRLREAEQYYQKAAGATPKADAEIVHATAFFAAYLLEEYDRSLKLYGRILSIIPDDHVALSNALVLRVFASENYALTPSDEELIVKHSSEGQAVIRALVAMRLGDRATAVAQVPNIFISSQDQVFETYRGFVLLLLREAARQGWGDLLLRILDETGASDRHWPLRAGYEAYLFGDERLMDINPEVRAAAAKVNTLLNAPSLYRKEISKGK